MSREFVINPDRTAILFREETVYSEQPLPAAGDRSWSSSVGKLLHTFDDIDYPFRGFPESISLSSGSVVTKSRLDLYRRRQPFRN